MNTAHIDHKSSASLIPLTIAPPENENGLFVNTDILQMIFQTFISLRTYKKAIQLSMVCKNWRIVLTRPNLWSEFFIRLGFGGVGLHNWALLSRQASSSGTVLSARKATTHQTLSFPLPQLDQTQEFFFISDQYLVFRQKNTLSFFSLNSKKIEKRFDFRGNITSINIFENTLYCAFDRGIIRIYQIHNDVPTYVKKLQAPHNLSIAKVLANNNILFSYADDHFDCWDTIDYTPICSYERRSFFTPELEDLQIDEDKIYWTCRVGMFREAFYLDPLQGKEFPLGTIDVLAKNFQIKGRHGIFLKVLEDDHRLKKVIHFEIVEETMFDKFRLQMKTPTIRCQKLLSAIDIQFFSNLGIITRKKKSAGKIENASAVDLVNLKNHQILHTVESQVPFLHVEVGEGHLQYITCDNTYVKVSFPAPVIIENSKTTIA